MNSYRITPSLINYYECKVLIMRDKLQSISRHFQRAVQVMKATSTSFPIIYSPQIHEQQIIEYFSQDGRNIFSGEHSPATPDNYVLCFTNRCGSNWLAALMQSTGLIGLADEYFNAPRLIRTCDNTDTNSLNAAFYNQASSKKEQVEGKFFTKLSWDQLLFFAKMRIIPDMMPNTKYILMHRRDMAAQALSELVAEQTGQWTSIWNSGKNGKRELDKITDLQIQSKIDDITFKYQQFWRYFGTFGIEPIEIYYEDLVADPNAEIARLVDALELNPTGESWQIDETKVKLKKQSGDRTQKRLAAFYANMHNHSVAHTKTEVA